MKRFAQVCSRHLEEYQLLTAIKNRWYRPEDGRFEMRQQKFATMDDFACGGDLIHLAKVGRTPRSRDLQVGLPDHDKQNQVARQQS